MIGPFDGPLLFWFIGLVALIYFLPSIVAYARRYHGRRGIFVLNIFFGWTGLGWLLLLIFASTGRKG